MNAKCRWLAGLTLSGLLIGLASGCGGSGNSGLAKPAQATSKPDMSAMPGFDTKTGKMQTNKTK